MADSSLRPILSLRDAKHGGAEFYFTGKPCPHGHVAERRVSNRACTQCEVDKQARRSQTPEWQAYRLAWDRKQWATRPDEMRANAREQYRRHKSRILEAVQRYQAANREEICEKKRHRYHSQSPEEKRRDLLMRNYGITPDAYERMYRDQGGACAICRVHHECLCVDHCHRTQRVRGLLCQNCNHGLGKFKDDAMLLTRAIEYLGKD